MSLHACPARDGSLSARKAPSANGRRGWQRQNWVPRTQPLAANVRGAFGARAPKGAILFVARHVCFHQFGLELSTVYAINVLYLRQTLELLLAYLPGGRTHITPSNACKWCPAAQRGMHRRHASLDVISDQSSPSYTYAAFPKRQVALGLGPFAE